MAGAELPCVIVDISRGGPGLGNIAAEQSDYHMVVKGGGNGCYHTLVLAPYSAQEMVDLTALAFEWAERYRTPVFILTDGFVGQMMEPVEFPRAAILPHPPSWSVTAERATRGNLITSLHIGVDELEAHNRHLQAKYRRAEEDGALAEEYRIDDAEIVLVGYGIVGRILKAVTAEARAEGIPVGVLRPVSLFPFPGEHFRRAAEHARVFAAVEMSMGQMVDDVRLALNGARPVEFYGRCGGNVPSHDEVLQLVRRLAKKHLPGFASQIAQEKEQMAHA
jgi:pyruvate/2-oxoacid:ferredoxin oxidoreductase alpha subunit